MVDNGKLPGRRSVLKTTAALATPTILAGCSGGDGGDGGDGGGDGGSDGGDGGGGMTTDTGPPTFQNEAGVPVGENFEAVQELAQDEPGVVLYSTADRDVVAEWNELFKESYPFADVSTISGNTTQILPRWLAEYTANNINGDFMITSSGAGPIIERGQAMQLNGEFLPNWGEMPDKWKSDFFVGLRATIGVLQYNYNMLDGIGSNAIESWDDFVTDDRWGDGNLGFDPSPSFRLLYGLIQYKGGPDSDEARQFLENLRDQEPTWVDSHSGLTRRLAAGQYPVCFSHGDEPGEKGQTDYPVDFFDKPKKFAAANGALINNKANNPNQAILFSNWLYSDEAQELMSLSDFSIKYGMKNLPDHIDFSSTGAELDVILPDVNTDPTVELWNDVMGELSAY